MDISCRQFHNEKRHCTQKHLFFSCTLTILLGALYLWPFMNEWMTVHGVTLCCVPRWLLSLLQQCLLQCGLWCRGQVLHLSVLVMAPTWSNRSWPHCMRAGAHTAAKGHFMHAEGKSPYGMGFPSISGSGSMRGLWGFFERLCQAKEALSGVAPTRGCAEYVYWCCPVLCLDFPPMEWSGLCSAQPRWQLPCIFVNIRGTRTLL